MSGGKSTVNSRSFVRLLAGENLENARKSSGHQSGAVGQIVPLRQHRDYDGDEEQQGRVLDGEFHDARRKR